MRIIIAGSRNFNDYSFFEKRMNDFFEYLFSKNKIHEYMGMWDFELVSGGASGVDSMAERYAKEKNIDIKIFKADWNAFGKSAGYRRNIEMAMYAKEDDGILFAFLKDGSRGTSHMIQTAKTYKLTTYVQDV